MASWPETLKSVMCSCRMSLRTASTEQSCVVADCDPEVMPCRMSLRTATKCEEEHGVTLSKRCEKDCVDKWDRGCGCSAQAHD